jgi:glycosyltransferase involved in cell wall biosynthesis
VGVPDVVRDGQTGWLVPVDDAAALARAVREVLARPSEADAVARAARAHVMATYGAARLVADIDGLYTRVLARKGAA